MRKLFPGYYRPSEEDFHKLWQDGVFSYDANVLLNAYRYTPTTTERVMEIFRQLRERSWITHQAAEEFLSNRLVVISTQYEAYNDVERKMEAAISSIAKDIGKYRRHPFLNINEVIVFFQQAAKDVREKLNQNRMIHPDFFKTDVLWEQLTELFDDKVGSPYNDNELQQKYKEAEKRYSQKIPPGYADAKNKDAPEKYGDAILWFQLLDYAKSEQKPIIFVTSDSKEDWWWEHKGQTVGPRPELIQEMQAFAGMPFYMYSMEQFISYAQSFLQLAPEPQALREIEDVQRQQERDRREISLITGASVVPDFRMRSFAGEVGPLLYDVNGDGKRELIVPTNDGRLIEIYKIDGDKLEHIDSESPDISPPYFENIGLIDIDNDEAKELVCYIAWTAGSGLVFYKQVNGTYIVLHGIDGITNERVTCFIDARIEDYDSDGRLEIISEPWYEVPEDLVPDNILQTDPIPDKNPWGRVRYVWRWSQEKGFFELLERTLLYIGGR